MDPKMEPNTRPDRAPATSRKTIRDVAAAVPALSLSDAEVARRIARERAARWIAAGT